MHRSRLALPGLILVLGLGLLWLMTPRLVDQFAPAWTVTAELPAASSARTLHAASECVDVLASERVLTDAETGRLTAAFHALGWEARRVTSCLREVPTVTNVEARRIEG
jgi:hypothetical protein